MVSRVFLTWSRRPFVGLFSLSPRRPQFSLLLHNLHFTASARILNFSWDQTKYEGFNVSTLSFSFLFFFSAAAPPRGGGGGDGLRHIYIHITYHPCCYLRLWLARFFRFLPFSSRTKEQSKPCMTYTRWYRGTYNTYCILFSNIDILCCMLPASRGICVCLFFAAPHTIHTHPRIS